LDSSFRSNVDLLAGHFHAGSAFKVFLSLVPWNDLVGPPNKGHAAIADLLITRAAHAALSANFDSMIEQWAEKRRVMLRGSLTGQNAVTFAINGNANPLVKFHGCLRDPDNTLWTQGQLDEADVKARVESCSQWMNLHLPGKDLVVVGFWTDWGYLNDVLANAFAISNASSVTVIDPSPSADLESKAPTLWTKLTGLSGSFEHIQGSGAEALDELRTAYSKAWVRAFYALGGPAVVDGGGTIPLTAIPDDLEGEDLYSLRCDAEGVPYDGAAKQKEPDPCAAVAAYAHMILLNAGATKEGAWLKYDGKSVRIINGAGQGLAQVKEKYKEPTALPQAEIVVCAGAFDYGTPARIIDSGRGASTVHPGSGGMAKWLTLEQAKVELAI
jgi:hypothetical protein